MNRAAFSVTKFPTCRLLTRLALPAIAFCCFANAPGSLAAFAEDKGNNNVHAQDAVEADVLLRGGTLLDGRGGLGMVGDVAIREGRIVAVGKFKCGKAGREIDCTGLVVCPGFIDLHNHSDFPILKEKTRPAANYLTQGCTTIVTGNCGSGQADTAEFFEKLDEQDAGVNVVHLIPQGAVRAKVMGRERRAPNEKELNDMRRIIADGMKAGAFGMSTGLIYVPSAYADTPELIELAKVVAEHGGIYASHIRGEGKELLESVEEALEIGRKADIPVHISHFKSTGRPYWGTVRIAAKRIENERRAGRSVTADQYPYIASSTSLEAMLLPSELREGDKKQLIARTKDEEKAKEIRAAIAESLKVRDRLQIASYKPNPKWAGRMLTDIAKDEGRDPADVAFEIIQNGGAAVVSFSMSEEDVRHVMRLPWVATASDGGVKVDDGTKPHPRSFGTFPRKIGYYSLAEKVLPLELAVRSASGLPADILGLADRGYLKSGFAADVVVFDPKTIRDKATFQEPFHQSVGVRYVFVNGETAVEDGKPTGKTAGRALRKKRSDS